MRVCTSEECAAWSERLVALDAQRKPTRDLARPHRVRCDFPKSFTQILWFSRRLEAALQPRQSCLVWVTDWGIFPSNENLHLFYRLRQTYGETRLLQEAPGHLCLDFESAEVVTLVHLGMLFGWDLHLIPASGYARAFVCHDEWAEIAFDDASQFEATVKEFQAAGLAVTTPAPDKAG
jgi:hypothetical protein